MSQKFNKMAVLALILGSIFSLFFLNQAVSAQIDDTSAAELEAIKDETSELQNQLKEIEAQIKQYQKDLVNIQGEKKTLQNEINRLKTQQSSLKLQISATNLRIEDLERQAGLTEEAINENILQIEGLKDQLAEIIREINRNNNYSLLFKLVAQDNLSAAIDQLKDYLQLSQSMSVILEHKNELTHDLEKHKEVLETKAEETRSLLDIQTLQQEELKSTEGEQSQLLKTAKTKELEFNESIQDSKKLVAEIKNRIYELFNTSEQINFGQALKIAQWASDETGVRAAFLLAILTQESNLGKNVGTCNRAGDPPSKSWKVVMKPERDQEPFLAITKELGLNPDITPVSCPMRNKDGSQLGWGGAMGPAQFIPSTWVGYKDKVTSITGKPANPWDIRDAFIASALLLKANGAASDEWSAALRYFSGGTNPKYSFYADSVLSIADKYQTDIDELNK